MALLRNNLVTLLPSTALAVGANNGATNELDTLPGWMASGQFSIMVDVTAVGGTPSCIFAPQWSNDGINWAAVAADASAAITAVSNNVLPLIPIRATFVRIVATLSGTTPTMTANVTGLAI